MINNPLKPTNVESTNSPAVLNLSSLNLTKGHFGIFNKGPKFVPTPIKADFSEFQDDYGLWKNRLRWAYFHETKEKTETSLEVNKYHQIELELIKSNKAKFSAPTKRFVSFGTLLSQIR